jgi:hypothetical protein
MRLNEMGAESVRISGKLFGDDFETLKAKPVSRSQRSLELPMSLRIKLRPADSRDKHRPYCYGRPGIAVNSSFAVEALSGTDRSAMGGGVTIALHRNQYRVSEAVGRILVSASNSDRLLERYKNPPC